ncbi:MAG: hypothetical protein V7786_02105 [Sulfitobacter litoralis]|uniref:hypothetical protein n=1 Tax=Sulfitobacter litoralis TaxID=335975 RepID=UPI00300316F0
MEKATLEVARNIAQFAPVGISYEDATKLVKNRKPKMDEFQRSCLAAWVCKMRPARREP